MNAKKPPEDDEVWVTRDARRLKVSEMSEDHVRAALRMVLRTKKRLVNAAILLHPYLKKLNEAEAKRAIEVNEAFFASLHDDVFGEDRKWGSD